MTSYIASIQVEKDKVKTVPRVEVLLGEISVGSVVDFFLTVSGIEE